MAQDLSIKYQTLIDLASSLGVEQLHIEDKGNLLEIFGVVQSADAKNKLWDVYNQMDPNYISNDLDLTIAVSNDVSGTKAKKSKKEEDQISIRKGPGIETPVVAVVGDEDSLEILGRANANWWLVRNAEGKEGYCYAQYLVILD